MRRAARTQRCQWVCWRGHVFANLSTQTFNFLRQTAFKNDPNDIACVYKQAVERHRASFIVIAFAIFYAGHGQDNYKIFKTYLAPED